MCIKKGLLCMNIKQISIVPKTLIAAAAISTGAYCASKIVSEPEEKVEIVSNKATDPLNTPVTAGTLFTLGLFGKKKNEEEDEQALKEKQEAEAAAKAGMPVEKYRSLFQPTSKCDFMTLHSFSDGYRYFNTAREWLAQFNSNGLNIRSVKTGFKIMNACFEQYEKENIKIFEEEDKAKCKQLMAEVSESIDKGEEPDYDKLSEIIVIYDRKRLYPYI